MPLLLWIPQTIVFGLVDFVITEPVFINVFFLITTPGIMIDLGPTNTPSSL